MKVLLFLPDISRTGGVERVVSNLANLFIGWPGYEVTVLSCFNTNERSPYELHPNVRMDSLRSPLYPTNAAKKIVWYLNLVRPLNAYLKQNQYDVILAEGSYLCATLSLINNDNIVKIGCEHIGHDAVSFSQKILRRILYPRLDRLVVLTEKDRKYFASFLPRVKQIPNFIKRNVLPADAARENVIISAGRLTHQKGFDMLLEAYALVVQKYPEWKLRIWGEGEDRVKLEEIIRKRHLESHVLLPGESRELDKELAKAMVFVMPSRYEGFPMTLLEAMRCGLACVSFDCSGPDEIIDHNLNGILVEQGDVQGLADGMITLIEDVEKRKTFAVYAREKVEQYSVEVVGDMWRELLASPPTPLQERGGRKRDF